jgi:uncharacterized protein
MTEVLHLSAADARRMPWKNGRGTTEELAVWPEDASFERGDFDYRIAKAGVDSAGPFSSFPGFDRLLVVTRGAGLVLEHGESAPRALLRPLEPYCFSGEWPTRAELVAGPIEDFNVLLARERCSAEIEVLRLGERRARAALTSGQAFAHLLAGSAQARSTGEEEPFELVAGDSLWIDDLRGGEELDLQGRARECTVLLVRIAIAEAV